MVAVSGNTLVNGRLREHNGNSTEFKFVFKSYSGVVGRTTDLVALMSNLSKMRTGTTEWSAAEFRLIPMECGWVKSKNKEQGMEKDKSKGKGNEKQKSEELTELRSNCRTMMPVVGTEKGNRLTEFETKLARSVWAVRRLHWWPQK